MIDVNQFTTPEDFVIHVIERHMEKSKVNLKAAPIIVAGGYGVGSKENFQLLHELATVLGGEVGASRAAVDAGFCEHERQIGQTGTTVRPKLYIACGISGQIQHTAGMEESAMVIAINTDSNAPINKFADYVITGDLNVVIPKMIQYYTTSKDFEDEQHIRAWLIRIVINKAKNTTLAFWRRNRRSLEDYIETLTFENPESENLFEEVLKLPEKYRIVIHLFYYEDYSVREIADILKLSESNVKTRLSRGRSLLKTALETS